MFRFINKWSKNNTSVGKTEMRAICVIKPANVHKILLAEPAICKKLLIVFPGFSIWRLFKDDTYCIAVKVLVNHDQEKRCRTSFGFIIYSHIRWSYYCRQCRLYLTHFTLYNTRLPVSITKLCLGEILYPNISMTYTVEWAIFFDTKPSFSIAMLSLEVPTIIVVQLRLLRCPSLDHHFTERSYQFSLGRLMTKKMRKMRCPVHSGELLLSEILSVDVWEQQY